MGLSQNRLTRIILWLTVASVGLYPALNIILYIMGLLTGPRLHDFSAYYFAAERFLHGYGIFMKTSTIPELAGRPHDQMAYLYLPIFIVPFIPFSLLNQTVAGVIWLIITTGVILVGVTRLLQALKVNLSGVQLMIVWWFVIGFAPLITRTKSGNISGLLAGILCFAAAMMIRSPDDDSGNIFRKNAILSGVLTAIPALIKPFYLPGWAHLLRSTLRLVAAGIVTATIVTVSLILFGVDTHIQYLQIILEGKGWGETAPPVKWNAGVFRPWYVFGSGKLLIKGLLLLAGMGVALWTSLGRESWPADDELLFVLGVFLIPLGNPSSSVQNLAAVLPGLIILLVSEYRARNGLPSIVLVGIILIQIHPYTVEGIAKFGPKFVPAIEQWAVALPYIQPAMWGMFLLTALVFLRLLHFPYNQIHHEDAEIRNP